jgi:hypothetical protein
LTGLIQLGGVILKWAVMPIVNRALSSWLKPPGQISAERTLAGLAGILLFLLAMVAGFSLLKW